MTRTIDQGRVHNTPEEFENALQTGCVLVWTKNSFEAEALRKRECDLPAHKSNTNPLNKTQITHPKWLVIVVFSNNSGEVRTKTFVSFWERNLRFQIPPWKCGRANFSSRLPDAKVKENINWGIMLTIKVPVHPRPKGKAFHYIW